jgi:hypothetical protein
MRKTNGAEANPSKNLQHELRTELSVICACCFLLRETLEKTLSEEQRGQLNKIERSAGRIRDLSAELMRRAAALQKKTSPAPVIGAKW